MSAVCKNHPNRIAKQKCYYCKQPICSECQLLLGHHYFCSKQCYHLNQLKNLKIGFKQFLKWLVLLPLILLDKIIELILSVKQIRFQVILNVLITCGVIASLVMSLTLYKKIQQLDLKLTSKTSENIISESTVHRDTSHLKIISPSMDVMVLKSKITILGEATDNTIISLAHDSLLIAVTLPENGIFKFENISAKRGQNHFKVNAISPDGKSTTVQEIRFTYASPSLNYLARDYIRGDINQKKIALTFDGDYLNNAAGPILDILKAKNIKSSFFLTGRFLEKYPETVRRLVAEGHELGNHTWSHPHLTTFGQNNRHDTRPEMTREILHQQLEKTHQLYKRITDVEMSRIWRAPYGEHNLEIRTWAAELGYRQVGWTVGKNWRDSMDTMDWVADKNSDKYLTAKQIVEKVLAFGEEKPNGANGCIILMHLGTLRTDDFPFVELPTMIDGLEKQGYKLVKVSELLD